jgi:WD40 repeat protein
LPSASTRVYDVASRRLIKELEQPHAIKLAFSANSTKISALSGGYLDYNRRDPRRPGQFVNQPPQGPLIWDLKTGTTSAPPLVTGLDAGLDGRAVEWPSPDSRFVLTRATGIKCWDVQSGTMRLALPDDTFHPFAVKTADGRQLLNPVVTADGNRLLSFYGQRREPPPKAPTPRATVPTPGQTGTAQVDPWVATSLQIHDIESGRLLFEMDFAGMTFVGLVPKSNTCVCQTADGAISLRDLKTGGELRRVKLRPENAQAPFPRANNRGPIPEKSQLTPDGKRLIKPVGEGEFLLFDLASGAEVTRFKPPDTDRSSLFNTLQLPPSGLTVAVYSSVFRDCYLWTLPSPAADPSRAAARKADAPRVRNLAGKATAVAVGGAGRYLLLTLVDARQLAVFDVNSADVVKTVPLGSEKALVAAGATRFVIAYPDTRRIERWDLGTLTRDGDSQPLPFDGTLEAIALGADSDGPLLAAWWFTDANPALHDVKHNRFCFGDITKFKVLAVGLIAVHGTNDAATHVAVSGGDFEFSHHGWVGKKTLIRASFDGSLFGICREDVDRATPELALQAEAGALTVSHDSAAHAPFGTPMYMIPSPDGRRVFHGKTGIRDAVFLETPMLARPQPRLDDGRLLRFPTTDPRFDFSLRAADTITIVRASDGTRLVTVAGLDEMTGVLQQGNIVRDGISLENRYHFVPAARLLVTIPPTNDRLVLRRLEVGVAGAR